MPQATDTEALILQALSKMSEDMAEIKADISHLKADVTEIKISQARTDERFNSLEIQLDLFKSETRSKSDDVKEELRNLRADIKGQDTRLWGFLGALFLSLAGVLAKVVFFPQA